MRFLSLALLTVALASCGASVGTEPYQLPQGANDLNLTPYSFRVYASPGVEGRGIQQVRVEAASMTDVQVSLPEGDFPLTKPRTFAVTGAPIAQGDSGTTFKFVLHGPPSGKLSVKIVGLAGGIKGVGCVLNQPVFGSQEITVQLVQPAKAPACAIP